jgi:hypothetical protein
MELANLSLGGECLGHGGSVASNVPAFGTKRTSVLTQPMSAFGGKADIGQVYFDEISDFGVGDSGQITLGVKKVSFL